MIDKLNILLNTLKGEQTDINYSPDNAVENFRLLNPSARKLIILFPPWHGSNLFLFRMLERTLVQRKWAVLSYSFHGTILEPNVARVQKSFESLSADVAKDVNKLNRKHNYEEIHLVGFSLGNVSLALTASKLDTFTHATFVVTGSNLASCVFEGTRTQSIQRALVKSGVTKDDLVKSWAYLAPGYYVNSFRGKNVDLIVSKSDKIIPTKYQFQFKDQLEKAGANVQYNKKRTGHVMTIVNYCLKNMASKSF